MIPGRDAGRSERYIWIIGGGLMQIPLIEEARELGLRVVCSDRDTRCAGAAIADIFRAIDTHDIAGHLREAQGFRRDGVRIDGVLAAGIDAPETMARLAEALGLPGVSPDIAHLVNNKALFRERLAELGVPVPRFARVMDEDLGRISAIAATIGYPLIVKNTDSSGSRGARILYEPDEATLEAAARESIAVSRSRSALIESFWEGPEQTVETLFDVSGRFHRCFITDREFDKSAGFALEVGLRHPSVLPQDIQEEMYRIAEDVATRLGITIGAAKYDFILTPEGPRIIEMTVRLSGGFDSQYLVPGATGKNVLRAAILTALGETFDPDLLRDRRGRVGLSRSIWPTPGRITSIAGLDEARAIPGVEQIIMRAAVGDEVQPYVDCTRRTCFIIVSGRDEAEASTVVDQVTSILKIQTQGESE